MKAASTEKKPVLGWWLSFADAKKPRGQMFVGCAIVQAADPNVAVAQCLMLGIWPENVPGLDVEFVPVDLNQYAVTDLNRMLTREDAERLGNEVTVSKHVCK